MLSLIRQCLLYCLLRPFAKLIIGMDIYGRHNVPKTGPAIIAANHNSHIDTVMLLCLFPYRALSKVRPVAAADHFMRTPLSSWFAQNIIGILPVERGLQSRKNDPLAGCKTALENNEILLIFPEGTRGEAETMGPFKTGVARLAETYPDTPIIPVYLQGAGRVLPRGAKLIVPFNCSIIVGEPFSWTGSKTSFMTRLKETILALRNHAPPLNWI